MTDDPLRHDRNAGEEPTAGLLRGVDAAAAPPPLRPDLAERVKRRARRRRRHQRIALGGALAVAIVASAAALLLPLLDSTASGPGTTLVKETSGDTPADRARIAAEVRSASLEAEVSLAVARRLTALEHRRIHHRQRKQAQRGAEAYRPDPVAMHREQAALTLVGLGDRLHSRVERPADALAAYRRAVELFPDTPSAEVARQRIERLQAQIKT